MFSEIERNPRRAVIVSTVFAFFSVAMLTITLVAAPKHEEPTFSDVFPEAIKQAEAEAAKEEAQIAASQAASGQVATAEKPKTEEERKFDVLRSLRTQE